jgi:hypothetical protein
MPSERPRQHDLELSDFTEPFGPRYSCALSYTDLDGWVGLCVGPRGFLGFRVRQTATLTVVTR